MPAILALWRLTSCRTLSARFPRCGARGLAHKVCPSTLRRKVEELRNVVGDAFLWEARLWSRGHDNAQAANTLAATNFSVVTGLDSMDLAAMEGAAMLCHPGRDTEFRALRSNLSEWQPIHRGRDLFVRGIGAFDIIESYEYALQTLAPRTKQQMPGITQQRKRDLQAAGVRALRELHGQPDGVIRDCAARICDVSSENRASVHLWARRLRIWALHDHAVQHGYSDLLTWEWARAMVTPWQLRLAAYFPNISTISNSRDVRRRALMRILHLPDSPAWRHLVRFRHFWDDLGNALSLDELTREEGLLLPEGGEQMRPRRLLNELRAMARLRELGPDRQFEHLDDVADGEISGDGRQLQVLRSRYRIAEVADALGNCARSYIEEADEGNCVLVALVDRRRTEHHPSGHPLALACWEPRKADAWAHEPVLSHNRFVDDEVRSLFDAMLPSLAASLPSLIAAKSDRSSGDEASSARREEAAINLMLARLEWEYDRSAGGRR